MLSFCFPALSLNARPPGEEPLRKTPVPSAIANTTSKHSRSVSPIDEVPNMSAPTRPRQSSAPAQPKTNIPMMRRQRRQEKDAANAAVRERRTSLQQPVQDGQERDATGRQVFKMAQGGDMRLDAMSEEPTLGSTGLEAQVKPTEYAQQPVQDGQEDDATGRQVFKMAQGGDMRWDAMSGEPTLGSAGLEAQVKPAEYAQGIKTPSKPASSAPTALERLRNAQSSFGEKVRKLTSPASCASGTNSER